ncbi:uncharacterized protein [Choristoneura fumiferana]|uniref:uncharacterized protein n=1 Tax=Choristoneura fumiferana TaxID=7141 RepID=UPI003D15AE67
MYQFPNQPIVHPGYQQCSFFGPSVIEPAASTQRPETESVASLAPVDPQPQVNSSLDGGAQTREEVGASRARGANKGAVDTSSFSIEQRVVAAVWVHERHHTHTSMGQIKQQFVERFGRAPPAKNTLLSWERKLFGAGAVHDAPRPGRPARRKLLLGCVRASLAAAPGLSVRARAAALRVPRSTLRALLASDHTVKKAPRKPRPPPAPPAPADGLT